MARPSSKAAKKRDPRKPEEWSVSEWPWMVMINQAEHPTYYKTLKAAKDKLVEGLGKLAHQFKHLDSDLVRRANNAAERVRKIPSEGGTVRVLIDERTGTWFQADIIRRQSV